MTFRCQKEGGARKEWVKLPVNLIKSPSVAKMGISVKSNLCTKAENTTIAPVVKKSDKNWITFNSLLLCGLSGILLSFAGL